MQKSFLDFLSLDKISIIQMNTTDDKANNLNKAEKFINEAVNQGAGLVCLPETFNWLGSDDEKISNSESIPGETSEFLSSLAVKNNIYIHSGSILEKVSEKEKCYNTSFLINPKGDIIAKYSKIHLFDAEVDAVKYYEFEYVEAGNDVVTIIDNDITFGFSICYDLRFPELYRLLSQKGADIIFSPAAFTIPTGTAHWKTLVKARAIENQVFMIACAQVGTDGSGKAYYGHSMVIDPWGNVLVEMDGESEGISTIDLDLSLINEVRKKMSVLKHRKL